MVSSGTEGQSSQELDLETDLQDLLGRRYLTLNKLVERLGVTYQTGLRYIKRGYLKGVKRGGSWLIYEEELRRFLESGNAGVGGDPEVAKASDRYKRSSKADAYIPKNFSTDDLE
jgi:excisionase family DNA binding protein